MKQHFDYVASILVLLAISILFSGCEPCSKETNYLTVEFVEVTGIGSSIKNIRHDHKDIPENFIEKHPYPFEPGTYLLSWDFDAWTFSDSCRHEYTLKSHTSEHSGDVDNPLLFQTCEDEEKNKKYVISFGTFQPYVIAGRTECSFSLREEEISN